METLQSQVDQIKFRIAATLYVVPFLCFVAFRFFELNERTGNRILYWGIFIAISYTLYLFGKIEKNNLWKYLLFYQGSITFLLAFILFFYNAIYDTGINNKIPILSVSISLLLCLTYLILLLLKNLLSNIVKNLWNG